MKRILYTLCQCTWGILQTFMGFFVFLRYIICNHFVYHGAVFTEWGGTDASLSLGLFVFISDTLSEKEEGYCEEVIVHEYGHTIQSLILGPLYLVVIGIPSSVWAMIPFFVNYRKKNHISYFCLFCERWANFLGEKVTGENSPKQKFIDF